MFITKNSKGQLIEERVTHRFTTDETNKIILWISQFKKDAEIMELIETEFGKTLSRHQVGHYRNSEKWQPMIQKNRERYSAEMFKVELANERRRIEELEENYWTLKGNGKIRDANDSLREIHAQLKKEGPATQNNYQLNIYKEMSEEEFDKRELELILKRKQLKGEITDGIQ